MQKSPQSFLSYSSLDIGVVRPVAEAMIASGVNVWFNEYKMTTLDCWTDDALVHNTLEAAVAASDIVFVFYSNFYSKGLARPSYCETEFDAAIKNPAVQKIVVLIFPKAPTTSPAIDLLLNDRRTLWREVQNSVDDVLEAIRGFGLFGDIPRQYPTARKRWLKDKKFRLKVEKELHRTKGLVWQLSPESMRPRRLQHIEFDLRSFRKLTVIQRIELDLQHFLIYKAIREKASYEFSTSLDGYQTCLHLNYFPYETIDALSNILQNRGSDREIYQKLIEFANWWIREGRGNRDPGGEIVGVHLTRGTSLTPGSDCFEKSDFGVTFRIDYGSQEKVVWIRKYAFLVPLDMVATGELDLNIMFYLPKSSKYTEMQLFSRLVVCADSLVNSIKAF